MGQRKKEKKKGCMWLICTATNSRRGAYYFFFRHWTFYFPFRDECRAEIFSELRELLSVRPHSSH